MKHTFFPIVAFALAAGSACADPGDVFGTFATEGASSHVRIADCGDGSPCGTVVWIDPASLPAGKTPESVTDAEGQRILGLTMLQGFEKKSKGWAGGTIYDPKKGKTYASRLKRLDDGVLEVKGCIGPLCQTQQWAPVADAAATSGTED
jgi:uncharacterized protein (DUF2147 family)